MLDLTIKISAVLEDIGKEQLTTGQRVLMFSPFLEQKKVNIKSPVLKCKWFEVELKIKADVMFFQKTLQFTIKTHFSFQEDKVCF